MAPAPQLKAIVKSVLSGDSLVLRGRPGPQGQPPKERILHLAGISAPRMGSSQREDEAHAFPAREFLRTLLVNKEVTFSVSHTSPASKPNINSGDYNESIREYGIATVVTQPGSAPVDIAGLVVSLGWAKVRETGTFQEDSEEAKRRDFLREQEAEAKREGKGQWVGPEGQRTVSFFMSDSQAFLQDWKGQSIDAIVESVRDGSTIRVRLLLSSMQHQFINLSLAGIKAPRSASGHSEGEAWSEESKYFVESRLLHRSIKVILLSAPASIGASPLASPATLGNGSILPPPATTGASMFIGLALHPAGDISQHIVGSGLAKVLDWHAGFLSSFPGSLDRLRAAEKSAKEKKLGIWENFEPPTSQARSSNGNGNPNGSSAVQEAPKQFEGTVTRVWGADSMSVLDTNGRERRIQLSSVRGPRPSDEKQAYWANEAKEFLRKKLVGKLVQVTVDYVKPKEGEFDERTCVTVRFGGAHSNVAELLIEKGFASVLRHRRDDEDRSPDMEKLVIAEQTAIAAQRGIHSAKEMSLPKIVDASESGAKASSFLPFFKRAGKMSATVEFVAAGSRFKVYIPKESKKLTFVLAGIRAPRTARNASEKPEPYGPEALAFSNSHFMQRDVEIEFETVDKSGGFIGTMYANKTENVAVALVRAGLASVHAFSAEGLPYARLLFAAEEEAKKNKANIWSQYDAEAEAATAAAAALSLSPIALPLSYIDIVISCVRTEPPFSFSVQVLGSNGGAPLEKLMLEFTAFHRTASSTPGFAPKMGDLVSAKFSEDDRWYRAKIRRSSQAKKEAEVVFIDYGNVEVVPFIKMRPLDPKFRTLPPQAQEARLSFTKLVQPGTEYSDDSLNRFRQLCEGRRLIANIDFKDASMLHLRLLDPEDPRTSTDPVACLNADLIREGLASIDSTCPYLRLKEYAALVRSLEESLTLAKRERLGQFEFGDVSED